MTLRPKISSKLSASNMSCLIRADQADSQHFWLEAPGVSVTLNQIQCESLYDSSAVVECDTTPAVIARKG
jgi:hypothetical protein